MRNVALAAVVACGTMCLAPIAFAQVSSINPMGMDLGALHSFVASPVPTPVTTYEPPPPPPSVFHHRHRRLR